MAERQPSGVAEINAQMRSADAKLRPDRRLVDDQYARHFVRNPRYKLLALTPGIALAGLRAFDRLFGGLLAEILLRGRHFEQALAQGWADGARQAVLIGAGYDTTAVRHPELTGVRYYEIDQPATQRRKREVLGALGTDLSAIRFLPVDLEQDTLSDALSTSDFNPAEPCVMSWLGVSYYLTRDSFNRTMEIIARLCAPGSTLVFDYLDSSVVDGTTTSESARRAADSVQRRGEPYILGFTPDTVAEAAEKAGFTVRENLRVPDLVRRYGGTQPYCNDEDYMGVLTVIRK